MCGNALALSGRPITVGTPLSNERPSVAVDASGTAYVAWAETKTLPNTLQYCVVPVGATACSHQATLPIANGGQYIDGVTVLADGSTIVLLADVFGTAGGSLGSYEPEQEWQSTDGGATFTPVNGGKSVAYARLSATTGPLNGLIVPGTGVLGFGWDTAADVPTFAAFPLSSPPECSGAHTCPFAKLEPSSNPDVLGNEPGQFASQLGANPGVLGIFMTNFTNGPLGCSSAQTVPFGTAYAYGSGAQSATNDYNVSPGSPNSAWKVPLTLGDCNVDYAAVGGGPSGFGIVEDDELNSRTIYHRFDQATMKFDIPPVVIQNGKREQQPSVSQDGAGGIYTTFLTDGPGSPLGFAYSGNGGASWLGPAILSPNTDLGTSNVVSTVNAAGQGWVTWTDNGSVIAQPFVASDANPAPTLIATVQTSGSKSGASLRLPPGTTGETDKATITGTNAASAGGQVHYSLFSAKTCAAATLVFDGGTHAVTGGEATASNPVTAALVPGTYYWQATYGGDATNAASVSRCGSEELAITPAASIGGTASSTGKTVTLTLSCAQVPCTLTVTITATGTKVSLLKARTAKAVKLGSGKVKLTKHGSKKVAISLTKTGRRYLHAHHGKVGAVVSVSQSVKGHRVVTTRTITITSKK
jgi:hypothetical protein